jgi:hypothetical protein
MRVYKSFPSFWQSGMVNGGGKVYTGITNPLAESIIKADPAGPIGVAKLSYKINIGAGGAIANPKLKVYIDDFHTQTGPSYTSTLGAGASSAIKSSRSTSRSRSRFLREGSFRLSLKAM